MLRLEDDVNNNDYQRLITLMENIVDRGLPNKQEDDDRNFLEMGPTGQINLQIPCPICHASIIYTNGCQAMTCPKDDGTVVNHSPCRDVPLGPHTYQGHRATKFCRRCYTVHPPDHQGIVIPAYLLDNTNPNDPNNTLQNGRDHRNRHFCGSKYATATKIWKDAMVHHNHDIMGPLPEENRELLITRMLAWIDARSGVQDRPQTYCTADKIARMKRDFRTEVQRWEQEEPDADRVPGNMYTSVGYFVGEENGVRYGPSYQSKQDMLNFGVLSDHVPWNGELRVFGWNVHVERAKRNNPNVLTRAFQDLLLLPKRPAAKFTIPVRDGEYRQSARVDAYTKNGIKFSRMRFRGLNQGPSVFEGKKWLSKHIIYEGGFSQDLSFEGTGEIYQQLKSKGKMVHSWKMDGTWGGGFLRYGSLDRSRLSSKVLKREDRRKFFGMFKDNIPLRGKVYFPKAGTKGKLQFEDRQYGGDVRMVNKQGKLVHAKAKTSLPEHLDTVAKSRLQRHGQGTQAMSKTQVYTGRWENDEKHGEGVLRTLTGPTPVEELNFKDDVEDYGVVLTKDNGSWSAFWHMFLKGDNEIHMVTVHHATSNDIHVFELDYGISDIGISASYMCTVDTEYLEVEGQPFIQIYDLKTKERVRVIPDDHSFDYQFLMHGCIVGNCKGGIVIYNIASNQQKRIKVDNFDRFDRCLSPTKEHILGISMGRVYSYNLGTLGWQAMDDQSLHSIQPFLYDIPAIPGRTSFVYSNDGSKFHCLLRSVRLFEEDEYNFVTCNIEGEVLFRYKPRFTRVPFLSWDYLVSKKKENIQVFDTRTMLLLFEFDDDNEVCNLSNNRLALYDITNSNVYTIEEERQQWEHGQTIVIDSEEEEDDDDDDDNDDDDNDDDDSNDDNDDVDENTGQKRKNEGLTDPPSKRKKENLPSDEDDDGIDILELIGL